MASQKKIDANQINARASTGPRTALGRARASRNAKRHGLSVSAQADPSLTAELHGLGILIAGEAAGADLIEPACRIAAAQMDLVRVREARHRLLVGCVLGNGEQGLDHTAVAKFAKQLLAFDRYEQRAISRRKQATNEFDLVRHQSMVRVVEDATGE